MSTGQWIRDRRTAAGLSQAALAQQVGVTQPFVSLWERDISEPPPFIMKKVRKILGKVKVKSRKPEPPPEAPEPEATPEELRAAMAPLGHLRIPGEATRRESAVFLLVATHRASKARLFFVGHTGDPFDGCNPVLSGVGKHFSHDPEHAPMRDRLKTPEEYDFDYYSVAFGISDQPSELRSNVDLVQEMERQLLGLAQEAFGEVTRVGYERSRPKKARTERLPPPLTRGQKARLQFLVDEVRRLLEAPDISQKVSPEP